MSGGCEVALVNKRTLKSSAERAKLIDQNGEAEERASYAIGKTRGCDEIYNGKLISVCCRL